MDWKSTVEAALSGNAQAWGLLFEKTQSMVYFTCVKMIHNADAAQDISQEVYISAMNNLHTLSDASAFPGWIKRIAVNLSKNYLVKKRPMLFCEDEQEADFGYIAEVREDFLPEEYAQKKETCRIITGIVDSLPEKQRICVVLYYFDELSVSEIAQIMDVSENTVKSRLNYARSAIKKEVEALEKKGTKLYCAGLPVLALILRNASAEYTLSSETAAAISAGFTTAATAAAASAGTAAAGSSTSASTTAAAIGATAAATTTVATTTVTTTTAATGTAVAAASAGALAKLAALPMITKIIAGFLAAVIAIGGVAAAVTTGADRSNTHIGKHKDTSQVIDLFGGSSKPKGDSTLPQKDTSLENQIAREQMERYWYANCQAEDSRFFFADITHDGIDELFSVVSESYYRDYIVYTYSDGQITQIFSDGSADMTNWLYDHYLIVLEGELYIIRSGFFGRQGYPLVMYEVFSLDENGERIIFKEEMYENQEAFDKEQEMYKIIDRYEKEGLMLIGFEGLDLSYGKWDQQTLDRMVEAKSKK